MKDIASAINRHFQASFAMLMEVVKVCPQALWQERGGRAPIWQIVYHTLAGAWVWFRPAGQPFQEPPVGGDVAELKVVPERTLSKEEVETFASAAKARADAFIAGVSQEGNLLAPYSFYDKFTNMDVILDQIRHIQHHVGYCNAILGEVDSAVPWT
jgi:hypothetical protein